MRHHSLFRGCLRALIYAAVTCVVWVLVRTVLRCSMRRLFR